MVDAAQIEEELGGSTGGVAKDQTVEGSDYIGIAVAFEGPGVRGTGGDTQIAYGLKLVVAKVTPVGDKKAGGAGLETVASGVGQIGQAKVS